jgi:hypothetical protein
VLQGLEFTTQVSISGVPSPKDYDIEIVKGGTPYRLNIQKELVRVILSGTATEPGEIVLRAHNHLTGKTSDLSLRVNLRTPRFMTQNSTRGYVGDTYTFDGRLESIAEDLMKVSVSGVTERQCSGAVMENVPLPHAGQLVFSVYINDKKVSSLDYRVTVIEPPAPELKYIAYRNLVATIEIHSYGKVNGQPNTGRISNFISGARNATKIGERVLGSTTVTTYELRLQPPREGNRIHLELKAKDARQRESAVFIQEFQVQ